MVKRFHCEFNGCTCCKYKLFCNGKCKYCKHGKIWHSLKEKPPMTNKSQFISTRKWARQATYVSDRFNLITIFTPIPVVNAIPISNEPLNNYCITVEALPV